MAKKISKKENKENLDDSELKNNEESIKKELSDTEYRTIIASSIDGFWIVDSRGRILDVNNAFCQMTGYSRGELLNMKISDIEANESPKETAKHIQQIIQKGSDRFETRHKCKDGKIIDVEVSTKYMAEKGGRFYAFIRDITERKRLEEELEHQRLQLNKKLEKQTRILELTDKILTHEFSKRKLVEKALKASEEQFKLLVQGVIDYAIIILDPKGYMKSWNVGAERITGYRAEEVIGRHISCFYTPKDKETGLPERHLTEAEKEGRMQDEGWRVHKDGSLFWASVVITALRDEEGKLRGFSKITRNLTERKQKEDEIKKQREFLQKILDNIPVMIICYDPEMKFLMLNKEFTRRLGWAMEDARRENLMSLCFPDPEYRKKACAYMMEATSEWREFVITSKDGLVVPSIWSNVQLSDGTQIGIGVDISERLEAEKQIRRQHEELATRARIINAILKTFDLNERLNFILAEATNFLDCAIGGIYLIKDDYITLRVWRGFSDELRASIRSFPVKECPEWIQSVSIINERMNENGKIPEIAKSEGIQSWASIPLVVPKPKGGGWIGTLVLGCHRYNAFTDEQMHTLQAISEQLALAIDHSYRYLEAEQRLTRLCVLRKIDQAIIARHSIDDILKVVLKGVPKRLGADAIAVSLLDEDQLTSQVFVMRLPNGTIVDKEAFSIAESLFHWYIDRQESVIIYDISKDSRLQMHNEQINNVKLCSYLGVPMIMKGKTIGILHLLTTKPKIFAQEDISFFETLAGQAAIAIENARLYTEALERSRTVERMINESLIIARSAPSEIADLVCQSVRRVMGVEKVAFFCYNKMKKVLFKEKVVGLSAAETDWLWPKHEYQLDEDDPLSSAAANRQIIYIPYPEKDSPEGATDLPVRTFFYVPLLLGKQLFGVLVLMAKEPYAFDSAKRELVKTLSYYIASALENARLLDQIKVSKARLVEAQSIANMGNLYWDFVTNKVYFSDEVFRIFGSPRTRNIQNCAIWLSQRVCPEDRQKVEEVFQQILKDYRQRSLEYCIYRPDGMERVVWSQFKIVLDKTGKAIGLSGIVQDITERKQAEEAIRQSEIRFRSLIEKAESVILLIDEKGTSVYVSPAVERILDYSPAELVGTSFFNHVHPEDLPGIRILFKKLIKKPRKSLSTRIRARHKNGSWRWLDVTGTNLLDEPSVQAIVVNYHDVTRIKTAEEKLQKSKQQYQDLVNTIDGIVWESDPQTTVFRFVSQKAEDILGYPIEQWYQPGFWQNHIHPDDRQKVIAYCKNATKEKRNHEVDYRMIAADGRIVWIHDVITVVTRDDGAILQRGIMLDISEQKKLEEQLLQSQRLEAVGMLAGGVAHDFNNILTIILGYSSMLSKKLKNNPKIYRQLEQIQKAGQRAASLTNQLLAFSRRQVLQPVNVNLNGIIKDVEKMLRRLIGEDIELSIVLDKSLKNIKVDPGQMDQVIVNLAVNARDAMPDGGKLIIETRNVYLNENAVKNHPDIKPGNYVLMSVSDTGIGMDKATQSKIFDPFFTTKEEGRGTGLGLSTVYGIVKQCGGFIWVYSEVGKGTTFKIYFPQITEELDLHEKSGIDINSLRGSGTILLVEDDPDIRKLAKNVLEEYGYEVIEAENGDQAIQICKKSSPTTIHLLLTDVIMPKMSGNEVRQKLIQLYPEMKVLFMTGYTDDFISKQGILEQGVQLLQKPFTPESLLTKVQKVMQA